MWGGSQNIAGQFLDSSGLSSFTFDQGISTVLTVQTSSFIGNCDWDYWADAANDAAAALGVNADAYDYRLYYLPADAGCDFAGVAYMGCSEPRWCRAHTLHASPAVAARELGHSAGTSYLSGAETTSSGLL